MQSLFKQYEGVFAEEIQTQTKTESKEPFNKGGFALADAVGKKSAKEAWVEYIKQVNSGVPIEMIHGSIVAKVRDILLSQKANASGLGIHPFVYQKAKADFKNWDKVKLEHFYDKLVLLYHESRMGEDDLALATEKLLLAL